MQIIAKIIINDEVIVLICVFYCLAELKNKKQIPETITVYSNKIIYAQYDSYLDIFKEYDISKENQELVILYLESKNLIVNNK